MPVKKSEAALDPLFNNNPIALQVLGICSASGRDHPKMRHLRWS